MIGLIVWLVSAIVVLWIIYMLGLLLLGATATASERLRGRGSEITLTIIAGIILIYVISLLRS